MADRGKPSGECGLARSAWTVNPNNSDPTVRRLQPIHVRENVV